MDRGLIAAIVALALLAPVGLAAQERERERDRAPAAVQPSDTVQVDTTLTPRERALQRLRSMPVSPVEPDTTAGDTLSADSLLADSLLTDALGAPAADTAGGRIVLPGEQGATDAVAGDSVLRVLRTLEGYVPTEYSGEGAIFQADSNRLRLSGKSRVGREGSSLETDSLLVYAGETGVVCGYGNPVLEGAAQDDPVQSAQVCFDIRRDVGMARGARTTFQKGATWYVQGADNRVYVLTGAEKRQLYGQQTEFTSCDLPEPHYTFKARSLKMVEDEMMVARNVTLQFEDVPVFWLPWIVQSMKRDRRSGLLMPQFGVNDIVRNSTGYDRHLSNLGFYWAINDYMSAQGTFEWYSGNWTAVQGGFAYRWLRQFLQGSINAKQYWRAGEIGQQGSREFTINTSNNWQPDERTRLQLSGNYATSTEFVRNNSFDPRELNRKIMSSGGITRSFDWGAMSLSAQRQQEITDDRISWTLPSLTMSLNPVTLYSNDDGSLSLNWSGGGSADRRTTDFTTQDSLPETRFGETRQARANHSLSFGNLSLGQNVDFTDTRNDIAPLLEEDPDTARFTQSEQLRWGTSVSYQQQLWAGTRITPNVSINGSQVRDSITDGVYVARPLQVSTGASLATEIYGFWPGAGAFSRIRHKISPNLSWAYAPEVEATELQERVFGSANLREQNRLTLQFNQTFEAKRAGSDTAAVDTATQAADGEPRRLPQGQKVMLLSLNTSGPFVYDFISAREEGRGFMTERVSNSIRSDLLRGFNLNMSHDLFDEGAAPEGGGLAPRTFDPFLTSLTASFSIDQDFWLFDLLGLTAEAAGPVARSPAEQAAEGVAESEDPTTTGEADPTTVPGGVQSIVPGRGPRDGGGSQSVGGWRASLNYALTRQRASLTGDPVARDNQMLRGDISFQPTEHWNLRWSTGYSFTDREFSDHVLTLSRDLHRWTANFDFVKAQNGNFVMQFRVQLRDNPDLKLDYDQRDNRAARATRPSGSPVR